MKLGIVGAGVIGEKHLQAAKDLGIEITHVVDRSEGY